MTGPGALQPDRVYHIFNRGINGEDIFREERNYMYFLDLYVKHVEPAVETYAYCLLKNHFHLLVKVRGEGMGSGENQTFRVSKTLKVLKHDPSTAFSNFFNAYAKGFNKAYGRTGSLFEHPFHRVMVTDDAQFTAVVRYIHQNPQKHGFVPDFREWPYSSYHSLLSDKPTRLERDAVLEWFGGREAYESLHGEWVKEGRDMKFGGQDD